MVKRGHLYPLTITLQNEIETEEFAAQYAAGTKKRTLITPETKTPPYLYLNEICS